MFKTKSIEDIIRYSIITGYLKRDIAPISLMIIAPPESNKTSMLKQFETLKNVKYTADISSKPLIEFIKNVSKDKYYHIIIPDFIKVVKHNQKTVDSVIVTINSMIEEGIRSSMYYGQEIDLKKNVQCGVITSITPDLYVQQFKAWNDIGFLSRFMHVTYEYSDETRTEIMKMIIGNEKPNLDEQINKIKKTGKLKDIPIQKDVAEGIMNYTDEVVKKIRSYNVSVWQGAVKRNISMNIQGFRLLKQLLLFSKAIAFDKGYEEVNYECLNELKRLLEYFCMPNNPKVV
jgi:hypothetical protein